jgi:hypothetical protein
MLPEIQFKTIKHKNHRYETVGDYFKDARGRMQFRVSDMRNSDYEFLVFIHEAVEWYLCRRAGITIQEIDAFDMEFESNRKKGDLSEPGHDPRAPYGWAHKFAEKIEKMVAAKLGVKWAIYDKVVESL